MIFGNIYRCVGGKAAGKTFNCSTFSGSLITADNMMMMASKAFANSSPYFNQHDNQNYHHHHQMQQARYFGRRVGNKSFYKTRPPTRKQAKAYRRKLKAERFEKVEKHSKPLTKYHARKEWADGFIDNTLDQAKGLTNRHFPDNKDLLNYDMGDALLDNLMGNTSDLTSTETPQPIRIHQSYDRYYNHVKEKMDEFLKISSSSESSADNNKLMVESLLPTDHEISQMIKAYRDKHSNYKRKVGVAKPLKLLLSDLKIPTSIFGEKTFTTLMTCATTPKEVRRLMKLMSDLDQPLTSYVYAILIDTHAKNGDFKGARKAMDECLLLSKESDSKITPTMAGYTSLFAACTKVVQKGNAPQKLKNEALDIGWESWKEMRIIDIQADAMAYGSIISLFAQRGHAEKCISLLEEMDVFHVKPTTFCFTSALRAVSKSHENAKRFGPANVTSPHRGGYGAKIAAYHAKMTREILIKAESAEVEQDNGFISALINCAGSAGDFATAKAIYLASEVRSNMTYLRTIGSDEHLDAIQGNFTEASNDDETKFLEEGKDFRQIGESTDELVSAGLSDSSKSSASGVVWKEGQTKLEYLNEKKKKKLEREYGKDTRVYSALLNTYANSMKRGKNKSLGKLWGHTGKDLYDIYPYIPEQNRGYLCEQTIMMIGKRREPIMRDNSIPGMSGTEVGLSSMTFGDQRLEESGRLDPDVQKMSKKLRRQKFLGVKQDLDGNTLDDLPPTISEMYEDLAYLDEEEKKAREKEEKIRRENLMEKILEQYPNNETKDTQEQKLIESLDKIEDSMNNNALEAEFHEDVEGVDDDEVGDGEYGEKLKKYLIEDDFESFYDQLIHEYNESGRIDEVGNPVEEISREDCENLFHTMREEEYQRDPTQFVQQSKVQQQQQQEREIDHQPSNTKFAIDGTEVTYDEEGHFEQFYKELQKENDVDGESMQEIDKSEARRIFDTLREREKRGQIPGMNHAQLEQEYQQLQQDQESTKGDDKVENLKQYYDELVQMSPDDDFDLFFENLLEEAKMEGEPPESISKEKAMELFQFIQAEKKTAEKTLSSPSSQDDSAKFLYERLASIEQLQKETNIEKAQDFNTHDRLDLDEVYKEETDFEGVDPELIKIIQSGEKPVFDDDDDVITTSNNSDTQEKIEAQKVTDNNNTITESEVIEPETELVPRLVSEKLVQDLQNNTFELQENDEPMDELDIFLYGMPKSRILKVRKAFENTLNSPSLLKLVPILRENVPENVNITWLRNKSIQNAQLVYEKAKQEKSVDIHVLNGMLNVLTNGVKVDAALDFYQQSFKDHKIRQNQYSDRLMIDMLCKQNKDITTALEFKSDIVEKQQKRHLDLLSYGILIEYYANRDDLENALGMTKECVNVHGFPPGEKSLKKLRLLCRLEDEEDKEIKINDLIGPDPLKHIRHAELNLKREYSKKGNRRTSFMRNKIVV